jgi:hypothetical protein
MVQRRVEAIHQRGEVGRDLPAQGIVRLLLELEIVGHREGHEDETARVMALSCGQFREPALDDRREAMQLTFIGRRLDTIRDPADLELSDWARRRGHGTPHTVLPGGKSATRADGLCVSG